MSSEEFFNNELNEWGQSIQFYLDDLGILQERLREVVDKNTSQLILSGAEHFQNQFIVQKEKLRQLRQRVSLQKNSLVAETGIADSQHYLRETVQLSEKIFLEVKHSFYRFLAKVL